MSFPFEGILRSFRSPRSSCQLFAVGLLLFLSCSQAVAQTGTFIDRWAATDLRVVSDNVLWDSIFPEINPVEAQKFGRLVNALNPDILNLQEIDSPFDTGTMFNAGDVIDLMNSIKPLGGGASWYATMGGDSVIVSKYPLSMQLPNTIPSAINTGTALALVDLPDNQFDTDFYFMNNHFKCCGSVGGAEDVRRQTQADALVNWMRDARTPGGYVNLPAGTPMAVVGDLNIVGSTQPLTTIIDGNIIYENVFGADSPPDWDGTDLTDPHPVHNGTGTTEFTYKSSSSTSRLDFILYTDSVVDTANKFVLNTLAMSSAQLAATGLQSLDVMTSTTSWDHIPVVVDFRFSSDILGDYDGSGNVGEEDFNKWRSQFGMPVEAGTESDGNGNGVVDAADYTVWRDNLVGGPPPGGGGSGAAAVPEPGSLTLSILCGLILLLRRRAD